jgi:TetR/AcrR family transcriptional regulator, transcriptional repressor for nem operon
MPRHREFDQNTVLEQAMLLFWAQGYEATSIRDLTAATGISSSSMYEVFGDKRSLYLAALEAYCGLERSRIAQMAQEAASPHDFIEQLFASVELVTQPQIPTQGSMAFNAMVEFGTRDAAVTQLLLNHYVSLAELIGGVLAQAQQKRTITTQEDPLHIAYTLLTALQGLVSIKGMKPDFPHTQAITTVMLRLLQG